MDFAYFLNILLRRKWLILTVVIVAAGAAWYLVGQLPPTYKSSSIISTGIIEFKGRTLSPDNPFIQKHQIEGTFNQLIQDMESPRAIKLLTDRLLEHEFQPIGHNDSPFRVPDEEIIDLSPAQVDDFALFINNDSLKMEKEFLSQQKKYAEAYGYDYKSLTDNLEILRKGDTDYLEVSFESENPELSFYALNAYLEEFFKLFDNAVSKEENQKVNFYTDIVQEKKELLDSVIQEINLYKDEHNIISVETQSEAAISQLSDFEDKKKEEEGKIPALQSSIQALSKKILKYNRVYADYLSTDYNTRKSFEPLDKEIKDLRSQLIRAKGSRKKSIENRIVELTTERGELLARLVAKEANDRHPWHSQITGWIEEKLQKEFELDLAQQNVRNFNSQIRKLYGELGGYQENDAVLRTLEEEKDTRQKEYLENKTLLEEALQFAKGTENPLTIIEAPERPEKPEASLRSIIAAFSGIAGGTITSILIFVLAFFDSTVQSPSQYKKQMKLPFLGFINKVNMPQLNMYTLFHTLNPKEDLAFFRESIRKLRSSIENSGSKSFLFVSPKPGEGKSFLIILVAYALSLNNKRILIIDTNFRNNTLSDFKDDPTWDLTGGKKKGMPVFKNVGDTQKLLGSSEAQDDSGGYHLKNIDIIGNKRSAQSPSEVLAGKDFVKIMESYRSKYDYILMEAAAMNNYSDALELETYSDKIIGIFSSKSPIGSVDNESIETLRNFGKKFLGGVLNNVDLKNLT